MTETTTSKPRDTIAAVRKDMEIGLNTISQQIANLAAAINAEGNTPAKAPSAVDLALEAHNLTIDEYDALPDSVRSVLIQQYGEEAEQLASRNDTSNGTATSGKTVGHQVLQSGPYQPILYNVGHMRMSAGLEGKIKQINRLISNGKAVPGAKVVMSKYYQRIWNREITAANRLLWDTHSNVAKAKAATKAGKVTGADSWNATTRKRQFYRKPDEADGSNAGKFDGLVLEMYAPKTGDGWLRVVEYTNPVRS